METSQILLIASLITNLIVLVAIFIFYQNQIKLFDAKWFFKSLQDIRSQATDKEKKILETALSESESSVKETLKDLEGVEDMANHTRAELDEQAKKLVYETISKELEVFQNVIKDITNSYKISLEEMKGLQNSEYIKIADQAKSSVQYLMRQLSEEIVKFPDQDKNKLMEELRLRKSEIEQTLSEKTFSVISQVASETLGASIDLAKHQELVMKALEKAKAEQMF